jgi:hypothetical protein
MNGTQSILKFGAVEEEPLTPSNSVGIRAKDNSITRIGQRNRPSASAYTVPVPSGWLVYTRYHSCRASLRMADGWTADQAEAVARILDGEVVL